MSEPTEVDPHTASQLESVVDGLVAHTDGSMQRHVLRELVYTNYAAMAADAKVNTFLPVLTGNMTLAQIEQSGGALAATADDAELPAVLVLDEHNSTRSQATVALIKYYAPGRFRVASAGLKPNPVVSPRLVEALGEVALELVDAPRQVDPAEIAAADYVIAIGADGLDWDDPGPNTTRWSIPAPNPHDPASISAVLADVDASVRAFLRKVDPDHELHVPMLTQE